MYDFKQKPGAFIPEFVALDVSPQELNPKWFKSHLLDCSVELQELYELPQGGLDLVMAEAAELRTDVVNRDRNHGKWCTAGYFLELAKIISERRFVQLDRK